MKGALSITRLHYVKRSVVVTPAAILALVVVVTVLIALILQRTGLDTSSAEWEQGARNNGGAIWSLPGFYVYLGVQAISTTFPYGMALGTTRKSYSIGTALFYLVQSVYTTMLALALFGLEKLTGGWFVNGYVFDVALLGNGKITTMLMMIFAISFFSLCVGGLFGSLFVKLGSKGPLFLGIGLILALGLLLLVLAPKIGAIFASLTLTKVAVTLVGIALASVIGFYASLRMASVR